MKSRTVLLALSVVTVALLALPAVASAGEWEISTAGELFTVQSTANTGLTSNEKGGRVNVNCKSTTGTGVYAVGSRTTVERVTLTYTDCTGPFGFWACTTAGQPIGTITTTELSGHNIMIDGTSPGPAKMGILLTPNGTHFASFVCAGLKSELTGNGLIAEVEQPCNTAGKVLALQYESNGATGTEKYMQITTTGTKFDLDVKEGTNPVVTASLDSTDKMSFPTEQKITCP
jgi:hypothetical protein